MSNRPHFFAGNSLNRLSALRENKEFLQASSRSVNTRFLALRCLDPLVTSNDASNNHIAWLSTADVQPAVDAGALIVLLGLDESDDRGDEFHCEFQKSGKMATMKGRAYWAIDMTAVGSNEAVLEMINKGALQVVSCMEQTSH